MISADDAIDRLKAGNAAYVASGAFRGDVSGSARTIALEDGQHPFAIIIGCSDSRVIPEIVFNAGIGELFVIRVAGNVIDAHQLGSIEYAADHLGCKLVVVLGHDHCGAVDAAMNHDPDGHIKYITDDILEAIGNEQDEVVACILNVRHSSEHIRRNPYMQHLMDEGQVKVVAAIYHLNSGEVEFL